MSNRQCESCHGDLYGPIDDCRCRGCDMYVCQLCADVFEHLGDGLHGKGNPMAYVSKLRTQLIAQQQRTERAEALAAVQSEYIDGLESACRDLDMFAFVHGVQATPEGIEKGKMLRAKIAALKPAEAEVTSQTQTPSDKSVEKD